MPSFTLHPRLEADSFLVTELALCRVLLMNNKLFPWIILVPMQDGISEITDLSSEQQQLLMREIDHVSRAMKAHYQPDRMNIAALGNMVPQLHIHVIARFEDDAAWPNPVWGRDCQHYQYQTVLVALRSIWWL